MGLLEPFQNHSDNNEATYRESTKLRNCKKEPNRALHTYCGKCCCKSTKGILRGTLILHVAQTVNTEQLQHYILYYFNTCTAHHLLLCTMTNKRTIISEIM